MPANIDAVMSEYQLALMVDRFHWLPSWILAEDYATIQRVWAWTQEIDRIKAQRK